jgi:hypothetical protein
MCGPPPQKFEQSEQLAWWQSYTELKYQPELQVGWPAWNMAIRNMGKNVVVQLRSVSTNRGGKLAPQSIVENWQLFQNFITKFIWPPGSTVRVYSKNALYFHGKTKFTIISFCFQSHHERASPKRLISSAWWSTVLSLRLGSIKK